MFKCFLRPVQALKFAVVGVLATLTHLSISTILVHYVFEFAFISNFVGYFIALPVSFFGHVFLTFHAELSLNLFYKYFCNTLWILLGSLFIALLLDIYAVNKYVGTFVSILIFPLTSYIVHTNSTFQAKS